ncbi:MAG: hydrogen peroxide-inducible genes activator [Alphaproteobacteria bacterium]
MAITYAPTLKQLRYLTALKEHGHFGRAADACAVTQPTLSAAIAELETLLGAVLVERTKRRVVFTPLGDEVVERSRPVLGGVEDIMQIAETAQAPLTGVLRLGVIPTISPFLLPRVLPALREAFPKLQLYLQEGLTAVLLEQLDQGALDLVLLALPYAAENIETTTLFEDRFSVVCPADHPLARQNRIPPDALPADSLLLLADGHCLRDHALSVCSLARPRQGGFEATSLHTLVQMVANGLGITLVPKLALDAGILNGTGLIVRELQGENPHRDIGIAWRQGSRRKESFEILGRALSAQVDAC